MENNILNLISCHFVARKITLKNILKKVFSMLDSICIKM
jgi:hypothetical protein